MTTASLYLALPILPGTATLGTGTGPGSITLSTGTFGTLTFDYYPIDATHLKFIETDYIQFLARRRVYPNRRFDPHRFDGIHGGGT